MHKSLSPIKIIFIFVVGIILISFIWKSLGKSIHEEQISTFYTSAPSLVNKNPGDVLRIEPLSLKIKNAKAYRILYVSQLQDNSKVPVSGMIFVPNGTNKKNIVAWAHGTIGLGQNCAPSRNINPSKNLEPWLSEMLGHGWIVVATDYSGLGINGETQYLIGSSEARDVLNSIRAAKNLKQFNPGSESVVYGHSQGGHSAVFTANIYKNYAEDVNLLGVVAAAPSVELNALFSLQNNKTLGWAIGPELFVSWVNRYKLPTNIINSSVDTESENQKIANLCLNDLQTKIAIAQSAKKGAYFNSDPNLNIKWYKALKMQTPGSVVNVPLLVLQGLSDDVVLPETTALFVSNNCSVNTQVTSKWYKNATHFDLPRKASGDVVSWINDRFNNQLATSNCTSPLPVQPANNVNPPLTK